MTGEQSPERMKKEKRPIENGTIERVNAQNGQTELARGRVQDYLRTPCAGYSLALSSTAVVQASLNNL